MIMTQGHSRSDSQGESGNRAYSIAEDILSRLRQYCGAPTAPEDEGRDFESLIAALDSELDTLVVHSGMHTQGTQAMPNSDLLDAIDHIANVIELAHIRTSASGELGTELDLLRLRAALTDARGSEGCK